MGAGCVSTKSVSVTSSQQAAQQQTQTSDLSTATTPTPVSEKPASPMIPTGWTTYSDTVQKFAVSYPGTGLSSSGDQIVLPPAVGNKERKMRVLIAPSETKLDADGCLISVAQPTDKKLVKLNGVSVCVTSASEGAAGSSYRTDDYTTTIGSQIISLEFQIRYLNSNRIVAGCETDADLTKQLCKDLVFDPVKDTALFNQIAETFAILK